VTRRSVGLGAGVGLLIALVALLTVAVSPVSAATAPAAAGSSAAKRRLSGITISPAFQQVVVGKNDQEKSFTFSVTNNTGEPYEFSLSAVDFGSLDESGGVLFLGQSDKALNYRYGLSQWVTLQQDRVVVEPKATAKVPITIVNKESLAPGGHYGAILVTPTSSGERPTKVQVNQVLSSLLFVTKQGGETYRLGLQSFELHSHVFSPPSSVDLRFQNAGNVHVIPRGVITVTDPKGRVVKRGLVNENSAIILPETFRRLTARLDKEQTAWVPGRYHVSLTYRFDGKETFETREMTFVYINGWYVVAGIVLLVFMVFLVLSRWLRRRMFRVLRAAGRLPLRTLRAIRRR
jgi:hypothetical protein